MIPDCISLPFIGIRNACDDASYSGLYINDLEGINLKLASDIADGETLRGETLVRNIEKMSIIEVIRDFKILINNSIKLKDVIYENKITGNWGEYEAVDRIGFRIVRCNDDLIRIENHGFSLFPESDMVAVVNMDIDGEIKQQEFKLIGGKQNNIKLDIRANAQEIYVYINLCGNRAKRLINCSYDCKNSCNSCMLVDPIFEDANGDWRTDFTYMKFNVICRCDYDSMICIYKNDLAMAIMTMMGIKLFKNLILTDNYNDILENKKEEAKEVLKYWEGIPPEGQYYDKCSDYYKYLINVVNMAIDYLKENNKHCIECSGFQVVSHCLN